MIPRSTTAPSRPSLQRRRTRSAGARRCRLSERICWWPRPISRLDFLPCSPSWCDPSRCWMALASPSPRASIWPKSRPLTPETCCWRPDHSWSGYKNIFPSGYCSKIGRLRICSWGPIRSTILSMFWKVSRAGSPSSECERWKQRGRSSESRPGTGSPQAWSSAACWSTWARCWRSPRFRRGPLSALPSRACQAWAVC